MAVVVPEAALAVAAFLVGVYVVLESVETFIDAVTESALALGVSGFFLTVVLAGTDLENLVLGLAAAAGDVSGLALGIVFGEALFLLGAAVGLAGLLGPFETAVPRSYLLLTVGSPALLFALALDGTLTRVDGVVLALAFAPLLAAVYLLERDAATRYLSAAETEALDDGDAETGESGADDEAEGDGPDEDEAEPDTWRARNPGRYGLLVAVAASVGMAVGSELAVRGARRLLGALGVTGLAFGATVMSFVASLEELVLTVEPVRRGRPHLAVGNVVGSVLFFVTVNAGLVAVVRPLDTAGAVLTVHWPFLLGALALVAVAFGRGRVDRRVGAALVALYVLYWAAVLLGPGAG